MENGKYETDFILEHKTREDKTIEYKIGACSVASFFYLFEKSRPRVSYGHTIKSLEIQSLVSDAKSVGLFAENPSFAKMIEKASFFELTEKVFGMYGLKSTDFRIFRIIFRYMIVLFYADDAMEHDIDLINRITREIKDWRNIETTGLAHPFSQFTIRYVFQPLEFLTLEKHVDLVVAEYLDYLEGVKLTVTKLNRNTSIEDYFRIRTLDVGVFTWFPFVPILAKSKEAFSYPLPDQICNAIAKFMFIQNDIFSFEKEARDGVINIVHVLKNYHPEVSFTGLIDIIEQQYLKPNIYLILDFLSENKNSDIINAFINLMDGTTQWYFESTRYQSANSPFKEFLVAQKNIES